MSHAISIIVPVKNQAQNVEPFIQLLRGVFPYAELVLVDQGSTDKTLDVLLQHYLHAENFRVADAKDSDFETAIAAGAEKASRRVLLTCEFSFNINILDVLSLVAPVVSGQRQLVLGRRLYLPDGLYDNDAPIPPLNTWQPQTPFLELPPVRAMLTVDYHAQVLAAGAARMSVATLEQMRDLGARISWRDVYYLYMGVRVTPQPAYLARVAPGARPAAVFNQL